MKNQNQTAHFSPLNILSATDYAFLFTLITVLVIISRQNYVLFHSLVEVAIITTGFLSFAFTWHLRRFEFGPLLAIGSVLGCTAIINVLHMLSFKGMNIFSTGANLPTQLWIASRYLFSLVILGTLLIPKFTMNPMALIGTLLTITLILIASVLTGWFPDCFVETGLTDFKIISEYVISFFLIVSLGLFWTKRKVFSPHVTSLIVCFFGFSILTELVFTSYLSVYDLSNMMGHIFQLVAYYFLYKAVVETGLINPFELMFRNLNDAVNARDEFISIASHELKTPLTPLKIHLQMLQRDLESDASAEKLEARAVRTIRSTNEIVNRLNQLIDGMLDVSRLSTGTFELAKKDTDLSLLVTTFTKRYESQIESAGSSVVLKLQNVIIPLDAIRIEQVITNIVLNSLKYAPGSTIEIGLEKNSAGKTVMWISDNGPGISKEYQDRIFDRYERGRTHTAVGGLGLGLYISREIIAAHGGDISLQTESGKGSKFTITL